MKMQARILGVVFLSSAFISGCITDPNTEILEKANKDKDFITRVEWPVTEKDLGTIEEGQKVEILFSYTNAGSKPLVIKNVQASCGCTVPEIPKLPVMPGKSGMLKAIFDSKGRVGENNKTITVFANTVPAEHELSFSVNVTASPQKASSL